MGLLIAGSSLAITSTARDEKSQKQAMDRSRRPAVLTMVDRSRRPRSSQTFWQSNRIVIFHVLSSAVLVLEWTAMSKPNIEHRKLVGYKGYLLVKMSADECSHSLMQKNRGKHDNAASETLPSGKPDKNVFCT
jgi:hypothetical protein